MNLLLQRLAFRFTEASKKFQIIKGKYLVPVKPKRTLTPFMMFSQQQRSKFPGSITQVGKRLGQQWKKLPQQQKKKYQAQYKPIYEKNRTQLNQYQTKYVQPFKNLSFRNYVMQKVYENPQTKFTNIADSNNLVKSYLQKLSPQQKTVLEKQIADIKAQRQKIQKQYQIPELQFTTLRRFMLHQLKDKSISDLTETQRASLEQKYAKYLQKHQKTLSDFAAKFGLSFSDFRDVVKRHQRKLNRQNAEIPETAPTAVKKTVKKVVSKTATKVTPKKVATKKVADSKKVAKKATGAKRVKKVAQKNTTSA